MKDAHDEVRFRVRYQETDRMGVVYHANHLVYFEVGRTELMRKRGIRYADIEKEGHVLAVTEARARFLGRVTYDDEIAVRTSIKPEGKTQVRFEYEVRVTGEERKVCDGYTLHVFLGPDGRPMRLPGAVRGVIERMQRGGGHEDGA